MASAPVNTPSLPYWKSILLQNYPGPIWAKLGPLWTRFGPKSQTQNIENYFPSFFSYSWTSSVYLGPLGHIGPNRCAQQAQNRLKKPKNSMKESRYGLGPKVQSCSGRRDKSFRPKNGSIGHPGTKFQN